MMLLAVPRQYMEKKINWFMYAIYISVRNIWFANERCVIIQNNSRLVLAGVDIKRDVEKQP